VPTTAHSAFVCLMDSQRRYRGRFPSGTSAGRILTIIWPHPAGP